MCLWIYVDMDTCYIYIYTDVSMDICTYVDMDACYMCVYIHIYTHTHIYVYAYIYICRVCVMYVIYAYKTNQKIISLFSSSQVALCITISLPSLVYETSGDTTRSFSPFLTLYGLFRW